MLRGLTRRDHPRVAVPRATLRRPALRRTRVVAGRRGGCAYGGGVGQSSPSQPPQRRCGGPHRGRHGQAARAAAGHRERQALPDVPPAQAPVLSGVGQLPSSPVTIERLNDPADPRLRDFTHLRDVELRTKVEEAEGLFIAEGEKTIRRAAEAGYEPRAFLLTEAWLASIDDVVAATDAPVYVVPDDVLDATTGYPVHRGALASMHRRPLPPLEEVLAGARRVAALEDVSDHTNLGAIFRSAAALGVDAVVLTPRAADPLYRRAVRTSMGAVFAVPWTRIPWFEGPDLLRDAGLTLLALTPAPEAEDLRDLDPEATPRAALAIGNEGDGLSERWLSAADLRVRIPMHGGIDSLNAAAAAAVAFFALAAPTGPVGSDRDPGDGLLRHRRRDVRRHRLRALLAACPARAGRGVHRRRVRGRVRGRARRPVRVLPAPPHAHVPGSRRRPGRGGGPRREVLGLPGHRALPRRDPVPGGPRGPLPPGGDREPADVGPRRDGPRRPLAVLRGLGRQRRPGPAEARPQALLPRPVHRGRLAGAHRDAGRPPGLRRPPGAHRRDARDLGPARRGARRAHARAAVRARRAP